MLWYSQTDPEEQRTNHGFQIINVCVGQMGPRFLAHKNSTISRPRSFLGSAWQKWPQCIISNFLFLDFNPF